MADSNQTDIAEAKAAYQAYLAHHQEHADDNRSTLRKVADYGLRGLGYAGGLAREGIANYIELPERAAAAVMGKEYEAPLTREGDLRRALEGNAPTTSEYLERAGVPEGPKLSDVIPGYAESGKGRFLQPEKGGMLDPSVRGAVGMAGDVATDPLTYLSGGLSTAVKAGKTLSPLEQTLYHALNPIEAMAGKSAKSNYAKAFNYVDKQFPDKPQAVSDILRENGYVGSASGAADKLAEINSQAGKNIGDILDESAKNGATVDLQKHLQSALDYATSLEKQGLPESDKLAQQIRDRVTQLQAKHWGEIPVNTANDIKSTLNSSINFAPGEQEAINNQAKKAVAAPLSTGIKAGVEQSDPEALKQLLEQNATYSSTSPTVQKKMAQYGNQVAQQRGPLGLTGMDLILAGGGALDPTHSGLGFLPLAIKKAGNVLQSTEGRTARGAAAQKVYDSRLPKDAILRNVWEEMNNEGDQK